MTYVAVVLFLVGCGVVFSAGFTAGLMWAGAAYGRGFDDACKLNRAAAARPAQRGTATAVGGKH